MTDRQVGEWLSLLVEPGRTFEVRAPKFKGRLEPGERTFRRFTAEQVADAVAYARRLEAGAPGVYWTLNPLRPDVMPGKAASDLDVERRRLLLVDCDPVRPGDTSASKSEKAVALLQMREVGRHLKSLGWSSPVVADSGNGYHLLYRVDLPTQDDGLVKAVLEALAGRFDTDACKVDRKVFNPSRICKLYGTMSRKGEDDPDRPHRVSRVVKAPESLEPVPAELLRALAADKPAGAPAPDPAGEVERKQARPEAASPRTNGKPRTQGNRPDAESRAAKYLARCDPAVSGSWGHDQTFKTAVAVGPGFNLTPDVALRLLESDYNPRCVPPWSDAELKRKVEQAYLKEGRRGWLLDADRPERPAKPPGSVGSVGRPRRENPEIEGAEAGSVGSVGDPPYESPEFEGPPKAIEVELLKVHPLPLALIPAPLRPWLGDICRRGCFPLEYPAAAVLVALSVLLGRNLAIRPKRRDSWTVVPNVWGGIVGPPGLQKTPAVEEALMPLKRLVALAAEAHVEAERRAAEDAAIAEARAGAAKKKLADAAKKGASDEDLRRLLGEASRAGEPGPPSARRYMVNDATVAKLGELLRENPRGLLQFRDELTGFFRSLDQQGHESDRGFYLETWTGNGSYTFDRIGRGTVHVDALCLAIFGTIQPGPLARCLKGAASGAEADGFVPRFQILVYPDPPERFVNVDEWPDAEAKDEAFRVFRWIDSIVPAEMGADHDEERGLHFLRFDDAAQGVFDEWREALENRLRAGVDSPLMACHLAKYRSLMPSLALVLHAVASVGRPRLDPVTAAAAEAAAAWCEVLESHARRVYQSASEGDPEAASRLAERIKQSLPNPFTCRQVALKGWAGLDDVESVRRAVGVLEDRRWAKVVTRPPGPQGGRPSEEVWVNPAIQREGNL